MNLWPELELFEWNGVVSIRELVSKKTVLVIWRPFCPSCLYVLDGQARLQLVRTEIGTKLVELMNGCLRMAPQSTPISQGLPTVAPNGNGLVSKLGKTDKAKHDRLEKRLNKFMDKMNQKYAEGN